MLTRFSHTALLMNAGLLLGLFLSKIGWEAYGVAVGATIALVLVREWSAGRVEYTHELRDEEP